MATLNIRSTKYFGLLPRGRKAKSARARVGSSFGHPAWIFAGVEYQSERTMMIDMSNRLPAQQASRVRFIGLTTL